MTFKDIKKYITQNKKPIYEKASEIVSDLTGQELNKNINYILTNELPKNINARYIPKTNTIIFNKLLFINDSNINFRLLSTLTHENTHAIQFQNKLLYNFLLNKNLNIGLIESLAYFNSSFVETFRFNNNLNKKYIASEYRAGILLQFNAQLLFNSKNFKLELPKVVLNSIDSCKIKKQIYLNSNNNSNIKKIIGLSIPFIAFIANDFNILKTEQFLLRNFDHVLQDLIKIKYSEKENKKIHSVMYKINYINNEMLNKNDPEKLNNNILNLLHSEETRTTLIEKYSKIIKEHIN